MNVFITGMHRSGTSMMARVLEALGYYLGKPEGMLPPRPSNPEGFWERLDVVRINNQILSTARASWDWPKAFPEGFWERGRRTYHAKLIEETRQIFSELEQYPQWAIKDPRICLTIPYWKELAPSAKYLLCVRNPFEVASSISHRHKLTENFGIQLWQAYYESFFQNVSDDQYLVLDYSRILEDTENEIHRLVTWLGISSSEANIASTMALVKPNLRNRRVASYRERLERPNFSCQKQMYEKLMAAAEAITNSMEQGSDEVDANLVIPAKHFESTDIRQQESQQANQAKRSIIIHYHLYKNAGTSVDRILEKNFGATKWIKWEGEGGRASPEAMARLIESKPRAAAISSHVADISLPDVANIDIYPILFLRHPLDRIASVYHFERKQEKDGPGPNQAKKLDLRSYVEWRLTHDRLFINYQTMRLAAWPSVPESRMLPELTRALRALVELPFFGLVECFDESANRLESWLKPIFPEFKSHSIRDNVTSNVSATLADKLKGLNEQLGDDLYERLVSENSDDLVLYETATTIWEDRRY